MKFVNIGVAGSCPAGREVLQSECYEAGISIWGNVGANYLGVFDWCRGSTCGGSRNYPCGCYRWKGNNPRMCFDIGNRGPCSSAWGGTIQKVCYREAQVLPKDKYVLRREGSQCPGNSAVPEEECNAAGLALWHASKKPYYKVLGSSTTTRPCGCYLNYYPSASNWSRWRIEYNRSTTCSSQQTGAELVCYAQDPIKGVAGGGK